MMQTDVKTARTDMRSLVKDAQDLFRQATSATGDKAELLRTQGLNLLDSAMGKAQEVQAAALQTGKEVAETADTYVQENPWKAVGISAGLGIIIGMLIARN